MAASKKSRRAKGEGSIIQRSDGRWMGRYTVVMGDGTKKRQCITRKNRVEVVEIMRAEMAMADKGSPILRDKRTTGEYLEYWIQFIDPGIVRPITLSLHKQYVNRFLVPMLGCVPLTQLKPEHIRMMMKKMENNGQGPRTIQIARNTLSAALREALKLEYVTRNVARLVEPPKYRPSKRTVWTSEQIDEFLCSDIVRNHKYYLLFLLLLRYGMRRGEVLGLRWQDIYLDYGENGIIRIEQALTEVEHKLIVGDLKTKASFRDLPILQDVREALLKAKEIAIPHNDDLIFHTSEDNPIYPRSLLTTFKYLAGHVGLPALTIHEARHTVATLMGKSGSHPRDAQMALGHFSITTTLQYYTHPDLESKTNALTSIIKKQHSMDI